MKIQNQNCFFLFYFKSPKQATFKCAQNTLQPTFLDYSFFFFTKLNFKQGDFKIGVLKQFDTFRKIHCFIDPHHSTLVYPIQQAVVIQKAVWTIYRLAYFQTASHPSSLIYGLLLICSVAALFITCNKLLSQIFYLNQKKLLHLIICHRISALKLNKRLLLMPHINA